MEIFNRSEALLGKDMMKKLKSKTVAVIGLGGVGSYTLEMLTRLGIGNLIIVDKDVVDETNINRQLFALSSTIGKSKVEIAVSRMLDINPDIKIIGIKANVCEENIKELFKDYKIDYMVDAIDALSSKVSLIKYCKDKGIKEVICTGMGNRIDPTKLKFASLNQTSMDPVCKKLRELCKKECLNISNIKVLYSMEQPLIKSAKPNSIVLVPATAGILLASYIFNDIKE